MPSVKETITCSCFICGRTFEWGHNSYHTGRMVPSWREMVCAPCDQHDGAFPSPKLEAKLAAKGIEPHYLENGFIGVPR